ncbi:MAG: hypothetical protein L3J16_07955, partial [Anaerolineales bacterium]|nr:hypothetical protein [Anaerolineales bacterium]
SAGQPVAGPETGIEGRVFIGPMCPVVQEGEACPDQPYQATLTVNKPNGTRVTQFETGEDGRFRVPLAAGEYLLQPESNGRMAYATEQKFSVFNGEFTPIIVVYDSGIR